MRIECPQCQARYRIDPSKTTKAVARVKCPKCSTLFEVTLAPPQSEAAAPAPAANPLVLVVDDSKFFREMIIDILKPLPVDKVTAGNAEEALEVIRSRRPALVLLDLNLPGKSGYDLIREVRQDSAVKGTRLLAMSGVFRKETDVAEVIRAGADDFINKSFKPEQLQLRVQKLLVG